MWRNRGCIILLAVMLTISGGMVFAEESEDGMPLEESQMKKTLLDEDIADGIIASETDGDITWEINADGKLTVNGTGDLSGTHESEDFAWRLYSNQITSAELNVTGMTDASCLFKNCTNLVSVNLDNFDTSSVTKMQGMFSGCENLTGVDVSGFDTCNVTNMAEMFWNCMNLVSVDVSGFNTCNVTSMGGMFCRCISLTSVDVSGFDTRNVTNMWWMFYGCSSLTSVDVSDFDTGNAVSMAGMFWDCSKLSSVNLSGFDTSKVRDMGWMFAGCSGLESVDLSSFNAGHVTEMRNMFRGCSRLKRIKTPYNVNAITDLPDVLDMTWLYSDGTEVTQLPQELGYSVVLTRSDVWERPVPTPVPTATPEPAPTFAPAPTATPEPVPSPIPTPTPVNPPSSDAAQKVQNFVSRMYTVVLGRNAEAAGLHDWTNRLLTHKIDGAGIADGFVMSDEFKNRRLNDGDYVDTLYRTFFNREADQGGRAT